MSDRHWMTLRHSLRCVICGWLAAACTTWTPLRPETSDLQSTLALPQALVRVDGGSHLLYHVWVDADSVYGFSTPLHGVALIERPGPSTTRLSIARTQVRAIQVKQFSVPRTLGFIAIAVPVAYAVLLISVLVYTGGDPS